MLQSNAAILTALVGCIYLSVLPPSISAQSLAAAPVLFSRDIAQSGIEKHYLEKRGFIPNFLMSKPEKSPMELLLEKYEGKANKYGQLVPSMSNGAVESAIPVMTASGLNAIQQDLPILYADEIARGKYVKNYNKVQMINKGDWKGMQAEADRKVMQGASNHRAASRVKLLAENSELKADKWTNQAEGIINDGENVGNNNHPLIRPAQEYRKLVNHHSKKMQSSLADKIQGHLIAAEHGKKLLKNELRAQALEKNDKKIAQEIAAEYTGKSFARLATASSLFTKSQKNYQNGNQWRRLAQEESKKQMKVEMKRLRKTTNDFNPKTVQAKYQLQASNSFQKRGWYDKGPSHKEPSHKDLMLEHYKAVADNSRGAALSENGEVDLTTPVKTSLQLSVIRHFHDNAPEISAKEQARAIHINDLKRVEMLEKNDWRGMKEVAKNINEQADRSSFKGSDIDLHGKNSGKKAEIWNQILKGKSYDHLYMHPHGRRLLRTPQEYRNAAITIVDDEADSSKKFNKIKKNFLRANALESKDKDLLQEVKDSYEGKESVQGFVSKLMKDDSGKLRTAADQWNKASKEAKRQEEADLKRQKKNVNRADGIKTSLLKRDARA